MQFELCVFCSVYIRALSGCDESTQVSHTYEVQLCGTPGSCSMADVTHLCVRNLPVQIVQRYGVLVYNAQMAQP